MQAQEAGPISRIESQLRDRTRIPQVEAQGLMGLADHAAGNQLSIFPVDAVATEIELGGEIRNAVIRTVRNLRNRLVLSGRPGAGDELVGQGVWAFQQVAADGRRQAVEGDAKFGRRKFPADLFDGMQCPARVVEKPCERTPGEKAQVGAVEKPFLPVAKIAEQQLADQAAITRVGNGDEHLAAGCEQIPGRVEHPRRIAQMFQHVSAHDDVIARGAEKLDQITAVEVGNFELAIVRPGKRRFFCIERHAVDNARTLVPQVEAQSATSGTKIEHHRTHGRQPRQNGQGGAFVFPDFPQIHMRVAYPLRHSRIMPTRCARSRRLRPDAQG